ncbi:MAG: FtsX-like permease family protein [Clostridiales bacterium]|nr:FtsX-like permease family protein [Clostridiales bacterium]
MYSLLFIALNNMKKKKGDIITLAVLAFLSSLLLYSGASCLAGVSRVMDTAHESYNGAYIYYQTPELIEDTMEDIILQNENISQFEKSEADRGMLDYRAKEGDEWSSFSFMFGSYEEERTINSITLDSSALNENDILIPYYLKNQFPVGSTMYFRSGDNIYEYNVAGHVEDPWFATPINISVYNIYMSDSALQKIVSENPDNIVPGYSFKVRFNDNSYESVMENREEIWNRYMEWASEDPVNAAVPILEANWYDMKGGGSFMTDIVMAIIMLFAVLILLIAVIVISFSIKNFIEKNMKNTGILEASGYTTTQLINATMLENALVALLFSVLGVALSGLLKDRIGDVISMVLGLSWNQPYNVPVALIVVFSISGVVIIVSLMASWKYKKITVLECLRGGVTNHNFKRNYLPFNKVRLPLPLQLSLKDILGDKGRNVILAMIIVILAVSANVGFALLENYGNDIGMCLTIAGIETGTASLTDSRDIYEDINELDSIDNVLMSYMVAPTISFGENSVNIDCYAYNDTSLLEHDMLLEGRLPQADNEITLTGKIADELGASVGDLVYVKFGDVRLGYIISGIDQKIQRLGRVGMFTDEGAAHLAGDIDQVSFLIRAKDGVSFDELSSDLGSVTNASVVNEEKSIRETISTVSNSMKIICLVIAVVTVLIVIFVEMLLIRSKMIRELRNYGISKALGFTTWQLMLQILILNIPTITVGVILGTLISVPAGSMIMNAALVFFGMKSVSFVVHPQWMAVTFVGIIVTAMITSLICSLSIRSVEPAKLLTEE